MMYGAALRSGQLSPVMPGWTLPRPQLYAVFLTRQGMMPAVRAFVDFLVEHLDTDAEEFCKKTQPDMERRLSQTSVPGREAVR